MFTGEMVQWCTQCCWVKGLMILEAFSNFNDSVCKLWYRKVGYGILVFHSHALGDYRKNIEDLFTDQHLMHST